MKILLVIDLQHQFKDKSGENYEKCLRFIKENREKYYKIIGTVFSQIRNGKMKNSNFIRFLDYDGCLGCDFRELEYAPDELHQKSGYAVDPKKIMVTKNDEIDIIGCDADGCVLATAFWLFDKGYDFRILADYIYSSGGMVKTIEAIDIMKRNFGKAVIEGK